MKKLMMKEVTVVGCDICGEEIKYYPMFVDDESGSNSTIEVELYKSKAQYEDGKRVGEESETITHDICENCFRTKLTPWIESQKKTN